MAQTPVNTPVKEQIKAILGGAGAAIAFAIPVVDDGLIPSEVLGIVGAFLVVYGVVFGVGNAKPDGE